MFKISHNPSGLYTVLFLTKKHDAGPRKGVVAVFCANSLGREAHALVGLESRLGSINLEDSPALITSGRAPAPAGGLTGVGPLAL
jgi:hypothetical protein